MGTYGRAYVRKDNMFENNDPYRPLPWVGRVDQKRNLFSHIHYTTPTTFRKSLKIHPRFCSHFPVTLLLFSPSFRFLAANRICSSSSSLFCYCSFKAFTFQLAINYNWESNLRVANRLCSGSFSSSCYFHSLLLLFTLLYIIKFVTLFMTYELWLALRGWQWYFLT